MVRATLARVKVTLLGKIPAGVEDADVTALCQKVDYTLSRLTYPDELSTTEEAAIELANDMVILQIEYALYLHAGGAASGKIKPVVLPQSMKDAIEKMMADPKQSESTDTI